MQARPWERYGGQGGSAPLVIDGPPRLPPPQTADQATLDALRVSGEQQAQQLRALQIAQEQREAAQAAEEQSRRAQAAQSLEETRAEIANVVNAARRAQRRSQGWFMTGIGADWIGGNTPEGRSLRGDLDIIGSNTAFSRLQAMRADPANGTGGALGSISERELQFLQNSTASLDPGQADADFQRSMQSIIDRYGRIYQRLGGNPNDLVEDAQSQSAPATPTPARAAQGSDPSPPTDPNTLTVEVTGGRQPANINEASPEILEAFANARRGDPSLTFEQFIASGQHRISATPPNDGTDMLSRTIAAITAAGINPAAAIPALLGDRNVLAAVRGAQDTGLLGTRDEITGAIRTLGGGTVEDNIARERGIDASDSEHNWTARLVGQLAAGFALPASRGAGLGRMMLEGGAYGAGYGFGSSEGNVLQRAPAALVGGGLGVGTALGANRVGNWLTGRAAARGEARELVEAADRQGIPIMPADVGGPVTRRLTAGIAQTLGGGGQVIRAAQRTNTAAGAARDRVAAGVGRAGEPEIAGDAARRGAQRFINRTSARANQLYQRAERAAGDARITPVQAWDALDRNIAELAETPGGAEGLTALRSLRQELNGTFTVAGMRRMRTTLRDRFLSEGLRGSDLERRVGQVVDAAGEDVATGLAAQGRGEAAQAYRTADRYWRNRLRTIDNVLDPIIGNGQSGEQIVRSLQSSARGNTEQLSRFIASLPEEEASVVRATLIAQLGRPTNGAATGEAFSLNRFLTHWNEMTPRARRVLFQGGAYEALEDIARVARGTRQAQAYANRSNTAGAAGSIVTAGMLGLPAVAGTLATSHAAGRLLASPAFARWLAGAGRTRNARLHLQGLSTVAARNPAIAQDVLGLQRALLSAANDNWQAPARRAAAQPSDPRETERE